MGRSTGRCTRNPRLFVVVDIPKGVDTEADTRRLPGPNVTDWDWQLNAACRGMASSTFFHPPDERGDLREARIHRAKTICRTCPVIKQCLAHALKIPEPYGIWGGLSEDERAERLGVQSLRYPARITSAGS